MQNDLYVDVNLSNLSNLPKDLIEKITKELSTKDFLNFCKINENICNISGLWMRRLERDLPYIIPLLSNTSLENIKHTYLYIFETIYKTIEKIIDHIFIRFGSFRKFLNMDYINSLHIFLYDIIVQNLRNKINNMVEFYSKISRILSENMAEYLPKFIHVNETIAFNYIIAQEITKCLSLINNLYK